MPQKEYFVLIQNKVNYTVDVKESNILKQKFYITFDSLLCDFEYEIKLDQQIL